MEKLNGTSLRWHEATIAQKEKIVRQFADIMLLEIERHPFDRLGSLIFTTEFSRREARQGTAVESQIQLGRAMVACHWGRSAPRKSKEAFIATVEAHSRMVVAGEIGEAEQALDILLAHRFRLDLNNKMSEKTATADEGGEKYLLKNADDKGDHILVNDDFDIVGIIDWEWCQTAPREHAFSSPCMMWPINAFYDGSNELAEEELLLARVFRERGRENLAGCVLHRRKVQILMCELSRMVVYEERKTRASFFMGLERAFDGHDFNTDGQGVEDEWET
ncbi:hypothetical protein E4U33_001131 [Claviceps sp. LM78 group G4]|nr:hypothetical protein E4U33_001131 [Claviceps sp. LM78 group G4]